MKECPDSLKAPEVKDVIQEENKKIKFDLTKMSKPMSREKLKQELEEEMLEDAKALDFEKAAEIRDILKTLA